MATAEEFRTRLRASIESGATKEEKLRTLREYCRNIPGVWHYPDDREPCPYCKNGAMRNEHRPDYGIRGYLGTGPFAIVSEMPSGDVHFKSCQAKLYYQMLQKHGLQEAFLTDGFNSNRLENLEEQKALFQVQVEVVQPRAMLVMDSKSYPTRSGDWAGSGPLKDVAAHLKADGFELQVHPNYRPKEAPYRAMTVKCKLPKGSEFSFDVHTIYHYTNLTSKRFADDPVPKWEARLAAVISAIQLSPKVAELPADLEALPEDRRSN